MKNPGDLLKPEPGAKPHMTREEVQAAAKLPEPRPAANARSPNRKPRHRKVANSFTRAGLKTRFLEAFLAKGSFKLACALTHEPEVTIYRWLEEDPEFKAQFEARKVDLEEIRKGRLEGLTDKAIDVVEATLEQTEDLGLRLKPAMALLRHRRLLTEPVEARVEHTGEGGGPITYKIEITGPALPAEGPALQQEGPEGNAGP